MRTTPAFPPVFLLLTLLTMAPVREVSAQRSLSPATPAGLSVTPVYEGWYRNRDGTYSLSFGYLNRNAAEVVDIPIGDDNVITPGVPNQGQPTRFSARRHWGVFAVVVPADFGDRKVTWTVRNRGQTVAISGSLNKDWEIDAIQGEASADNTPPALGFVAGGPAGQGPLGITSAPYTVKVNTPLSVSLIVKDDGKAEPIARAPTPVDLTWFVHQGTGAVTLTPATMKLTATGGNATVVATFSQPGEYLLRVRANDSNVVSAGHSQCCWTNAFVRVSVTP